MALTQAEMAEALSSARALNKREARELVDLFFEEVRAALSTGSRSSYPALEISICRTKTSGAKPKTGEEIPISARRVGHVPSRPKAESTGRSLCWSQR